MRPFFALALLLTGCILDHETKIIHEEYQVDPNCLREDSTTWTDSTETRHMSCILDLTDPRPPAPDTLTVRK